jgi:hypothetical protein
VTGTGPAAPGYRLVDLSSFGGIGATVGVAMIDSVGTTRWYLGQAHEEINPQAVWAGVKLRDDGTIMYTRQAAFVVKDELGTDVLRVDSKDLGLFQFHHDSIELPNGNFLLMNVSFQEFFYPGEAAQVLYGDYLVEIDQTGAVQWSWNAFDHLDPRRRGAGFNKGIPLTDPETGRAAKDWTHGNAVVHVPADDTILLSLRHQDWILKIDRVTGEVIWRLGDGGDFTLEAGRWFFHQHSPEIQPDGTLLLYDNGTGNPDQPDAIAQSRAVIYKLDETAMTARQVWEDGGPTRLSDIMGDVDRLPSGGYLILDSALGFENGWDEIHSRLREVTAGPNSREVWSIGTQKRRFFYRATLQNRLVGETAGEARR